eukprot:1619849-Rhodomonas_salina.2
MVVSGSELPLIFLSFGLVQERLGCCHRLPPPPHSQPRTPPCLSPPFPCSLPRNLLSCPGCIDDLVLGFCTGVAVGTECCAGTIHRSSRTRRSQTAPSPPSLAPSQVCTKTTNRSTTPGVVKPQTRVQPHVQYNRHAGVVKPQTTAHAHVQ